MSVLRLLYRLPLLVLHFLLGLPLVLLASVPPLPRIQFGNCSLDVIVESWWTATACRIFGLRISVTGQVENAASLVVANHISWLDIPLLYSVAPMGFVSKAEVGNWPILGFIARFGNSLFHSRGSQDSARKVLADMTECLQQGKRVTIFPEGGILPGPAIKPFHARMFAAAVESHTRVQPVMLRYVKDGRHYEDIRFKAGEHFLENFFRVLGQPVRQAEVAILQPIPAKDKPRKELAKAAQAAVAEAYDEGMLW
jgi:1-acyl-sn-glycerol-3-phosphate acyltransferase